MSYWRSLFAFFGSGASDVDSVRMDASTHTLQTIEYEHHEIHSGSSFTTTDVVQVDTTSQKWHLTTPDSLKYMHAVFDVECTGEMSVSLSEGSDRAGAINLPEINRRRVGTPTPATMSVARGVTGGTTDGAIVIFVRRMGATANGGKTVATGSGRGTNEWILKPDTSYVLTATTFADVYVSFAVHWYEHTDKD